MKLYCDPNHPEYLFLALRDSGDNYLLECPHNSMLDSKQYSSLNKNPFIFQTNAVWGYSFAVWYIYSHQW